MKPTFLNYDKPLLTAMILCRTPEACIEKIKASAGDGAEAFGIQLERLRREYRTKENLTEIFNSCDGKPIYVTSYRYGENDSFSDEECAQLLLLALDCGATLCDIMGDMFGRSPQYELAVSEEAVNKQKSLIDEIHRRGGEVLMSSHTYKSTTIEENLMIAKAHAERGADIIKIVNNAETADEIPKYIEAIQRIIKMTDKKLLFLVSGEGRIIREIGPNFGVCMYLCVQNHGPYDTPMQPFLKNIKLIRDNIRF
ncbi:MAG: type I 3-dehydroquinate dehydratase [Clostridia bacterium]|nr:type I 3-dehydroquinate dehydratase [Clostridia bacterium]